MTDKDSDTTCDGCGYEWPVGGLRESKWHARDGPARLCELCLETPAGQYLLGPAGGNDIALLFRAMCLIGNRVRDDLYEARKREPFR